MSLREEIRISVTSYMEGLQGTILGEKATNEILTIFEKRIDEEIKKIDNRELGWNHCNPSWREGVKDGYEFARSLLK